jgi:putative phosphoserine phosphatase/1-acylglycerol-3-phosphate O-acyltransferase
MTKRKGAIFDIDGTVSKGFIIVELPVFLVKQKLLESAMNNKIQRLFRSFVNKKVDPKLVAREIPSLLAKGLKNQKQSDILEATAIFMKKHQKKIYPHSREIIQLMKENGYYTIAISGSPDFAIKELLFLGFDETYGSTFEVVDGLFSGKMGINLSLSEKKEEIFEQIVENSNIGLSDSFGFGDTEHDLPILNKVGNPIVVNPNTKLSAIAEEKKWTIIRENTDITLLLNLIELKNKIEKSIR